jgi:hypothetical protein
MAKNDAYDYRNYPDRHIRIPSEIVDQHHETVSGKRPDSCSTDFVAARGDSQKASPHIDEKGIVALVCRHGFVWKYVDIVRSGEA